MKWSLLSLGGLHMGTSQALPLIVKMDRQNLGLEQKSQCLGILFTGQCLFCFLDFSYSEVDFIRLTVYYSPMLYRCLKLFAVWKWLNMSVEDKKRVTLSSTYLSNFQAECSMCLKDCCSHSHPCAFLLFKIFKCLNVKRKMCHAFLWGMGKHVYMYVCVHHAYNSLER